MLVGMAVQHTRRTAEFGNGSSSERSKYSEYMLSISEGSPEDVVDEPNGPSGPSLIVNTCLLGYKIRP